MDHRSNKGSISTGLMALELQLKSILEEAGGDRVVGLLDLLCNLTKSEQEIILDTFSKVVTRVVNGESRLVTQTDVEMKAFEDGLYQEILVAIQNEVDGVSDKKLQVIAGGRSRDNSLIDLAEVRKARKLDSKPVVI